MNVHRPTQFMIETEILSKGGMPADYDFNELVRSLHKGENVHSIPWMDRTFMITELIKVLMMELYALANPRN